MAHTCSSCDLPDECPNPEWHPLVPCKYWKAKSQKQYACLSCGLVHNTEPVKERVDEPYVCRKMLGSSPEWHGYMWYRVCPACGNKHHIKSEEDKK